MTATWEKERETKPGSSKEEPLTNNREPPGHPKLLWEEIQSSIPASEQPEIRHILGESILHTNECLHSELGALVAILHDFQSSTAEARVTRREQQRAQAALRDSQHRVFLVAQLKQLLLANKAMRQTSGSTKEASIVSYVLQSQVGVEGGINAETKEARPVTAPSLATDLEVQTRCRPDSAMAAFDDASNNRVKHQCSLADIELTQATLRQAFREEQARLYRDIEWTRNWLEQEHDELIQEKQEQIPPSLAELRALSDKLEREQWTTGEDRPKYPSPKKKTLDPLMRYEEVHDEDPHPCPSPIFASSSSSGSFSLAKNHNEKSTKVHRIRSTVQMNRDEEFLT